MGFAGWSLRDLEYLSAVAEERHFGRAAARCGVSQPALSGQIRKLENLLGCTVFERTSRQMLITSRGELVLAQVRRVLGEAQILADIARGWSENLAGPLRLGAIETLGPYLFPHVLRPLRKAYPKLDLQLREDRTQTLLAALQLGELDAVLLALPIPSEGLVTAELFFEPFFVAHPPGHGVERRKPLRLEGLEDADLLLLEEGHCLRDHALAACGRTNGTHRQATSLETLRHMIAAGAGYSLFPALAVRAEPGLQELVAYSPMEHSAGRRIALVWRATDPRRSNYELLAKQLRESAPDAIVRPHRSAVQPSARRRK